MSPVLGVGLQVGVEVRIHAPGDRYNRARGFVVSERKEESRSPWPSLSWGVDIEGAPHGRFYASDELEVLE